MYRTTKHHNANQTRLAQAHLVQSESRSPYSRNMTYSSLVLTHAWPLALIEHAIEGPCQMPLGHLCCVRQSGS